jgi:hypothetical protein
MTGKDLIRVIGQIGLYHTLNGLSIAVTVTDARNAFGRIDYQITPVSGNGSAWIEAKFFTKG